MARIKLDLSTIIHFSIEIPVRITGVNYGGDPDNNALLSFFMRLGCDF